MSLLTPLQASTEQKLLTEFTIFNNLPTELRLKIWGLAASGGMVVWDKNGVSRLSKGFGGILQANRESRSELRHKYTIFYAGIMIHSNISGTKVEKTYKVKQGRRKLRISPVFMDYEQDIFGWHFTPSTLESSLRLGFWSSFSVQFYFRHTSVMKPVRRLAFHLPVRLLLCRDYDTIHRQNTQELETKYFPGYFDREHLWSFLSTYFPVLEEVQVVLVKDLSCTRNIDTRYHDYTGGDKATDDAISKIIKSFDKAQKAGNVKKNVALKFMQTSGYKNIHISALEDEWKRYLGAPSCAYED